MAIMHEKQIAFIIASVQSVALIAVLITRCFYVSKTNTTISDVATADVETDVIGVYVMDSAPAEAIEDAKDSPLAS